MTDKATEGRTEAAAVDQAIADVDALVATVRNGLYSSPGGGPSGNREAADAALRVLADAVEELRADVQGQTEAAKENYLAAVEAEAERDREREGSMREAAKHGQIIVERVRLARQVADLEAALREYDDIWDDMLRGVSITHVANRIHRARAALAAARSRDPQEPCEDRDLEYEPNDGFGPASRDPQEGA